MKHKFLAINKPNIIIKSNNFCCFVSLPVPYSFWFSYQQITVTILINTAFRGESLIRKEALVRGRRLFQCEYAKVRRLFEAERLLKKKRQLSYTCSVTYSSFLNLFSHSLTSFLAGYIRLPQFQRDSLTPLYFQQPLMCS